MELDEILRVIDRADSSQMERILRAVVRKMDTLHPDSECILLMLPAKDLGQRQRVLRKAEEICMGSITGSDT